MAVEGSSGDTDVVRRGGGARPLPTVLGVRLRHRLGSGGEGEVWAADEDDVVRALKLIRPRALADPDTFARRGDDLANIDDPALVRVHRAGIVAAGEWAGWGAMVMDLVEGEPLDDARLGARTYRDLRPLAAALDRLHAGQWSNGAPLVHRDVKPANLIRSPDGHIVLVDPSTLRGVGGDMTFVGTPVFVAPEVVSGRFGPAADVYSFAATLVALQTGARGHRLARLLDDPWAVDVPDAVAAALSVHPASRPTSCADLVDLDVRATIVGARAVSADSAAAAPHARATARTWWRYGLLTLAMLPVIAGLVLDLPLGVVLGLGAVAGLSATDASLREPGLLWLPLAAARWLVRPLAEHPERDRVLATVYGGLLLPLVPVLGLLSGAREQMIVLGTVGQLMGVAALASVLVVGVAVATIGTADSRWSPGRVMLSPAWIGGVFALAVGRVATAIGDALHAAEQARGDDAGTTSSTAGDDDRASRS